MLIWSKSHLLSNPIYSKLHLHGIDRSKRNSSFSNNFLASMLWTWYHTVPLLCNDDIFSVQQCQLQLLLLSNLKIQHFEWLSSQRNLFFLDRPKMLEDFSHLLFVIRNFSQTLALTWRLKVEADSLDLPIEQTK